MNRLVLTQIVFASALFAFDASVPASASSYQAPSLGAVADCSSTDCLPEFVIKHESVVFGEKPRNELGSNCCPAGD